MKNERIKVNLKFKDNITEGEEVGIFERIFNILDVADEDSNNATNEFGHGRDNTVLRTQTPSLSKEGII